MIHIDLNIVLRGVNADAEAIVKTELERRMLTFIFDTVNQVAERQDFRFSHKDVGVTGTVTQD